MGPQSQQMEDETNAVSGTRASCDGRKLLFHVMKFGQNQLLHCNFVRKNMVIIGQVLQAIMTNYLSIYIL